MQRKRLVSLLSMVPILAALCLAAYKFGPSPDRATRPAPTGPVASAAPAPPEPESRGTTQLFELFGMHQTAVGRGKVAVTPGEYVDSVEAMYRQRGYRKVEPLQEPVDAKVQQKRKRISRTAEPLAKFFQRSDEGGVITILATGEDADYSSKEIANEPYTFSTLVIPVASGGSEWATYRLGLDSTKVAQLERLEHDDFPGFDPANVPRPTGLQRIYAYSSGSASIAIYKSRQMSDVALLSHYFQQMPKHGWRLDDAATAAANKMVPGVICFTQGARSCLIWVTPGKDKTTANVTISSH
jgi:hypothetical protein